MKMLRCKSIPVGACVIAVAAARSNAEANKRGLAGHGAEWQADALLGVGQVAKTQPVWEYDQEFMGRRKDAGIYKLKPGSPAEPKHVTASNVVRRGKRHPCRGDQRTQAISKVASVARGAGPDKIEENHRMKDMCGSALHYGSFALPGLRSRTFLNDADPELARKIRRLNRSTIPLILRKGRLYEKAWTFARRAWSDVPDNGWDAA